MPTHFYLKAINLRDRHFKKIVEVIEISQNYK